MKSKTIKFSDNKKNNKYDLEERTSVFGEKTIELCKSIQKCSNDSNYWSTSKIGYEYWCKLLRSKWSKL